MNDRQALAIVAALANGANPLTGEMFAADSPYQTAAVVRALFAAARALENAIAVKNNAGETAAGAAAKPASIEKDPTRLNAGKPWSSEEDTALLAAFDAKQSIVELAKAHGRTQNGVRARLEKHGRLPPGEARWSRPTKAVEQVRDGNYWP